MGLGCGSARVSRDLVPDQSSTLQPHELVGRGESEPSLPVLHFSIHTAMGSPGLLDDKAAPSWRLGSPSLPRGAQCLRRRL